MNWQPAFYLQEQAGRSQAYKLQYNFSITAAKTVSITPQVGNVLSFFDAITQAQIDAALGSTNEFTAAKFDATSMGADMFGLIVNCNGQIAKLIKATAQCFSGTDFQTLVSTATLTALADTTLASQASASSLGNLGAKFNFGNTPDFDALTSGLIVVTFDVVLK